MDCIRYFIYAYADICYITPIFTTLLSFRLLTGIGATTLVVLAPLLITIFFDQGNMGIAMGIFNAAVPFGTVIAANLFGILGERMPWQSIMLAIVSISIILILGGLKAKMEQ